MSNASQTVLGWLLSQRHLFPATVIAARTGIDLAEVKKALRALKAEGKVTSNGQFWGVA